MIAVLIKLELWVMSDVLNLVDSIAWHLSEITAAGVF